MGHVWQEQGEPPVETDTYHFTVGHYTCVAIRDGDDWDRNVLLIITDQHRVLIDTGLGRDTSPTPALLMERLQAAGHSPSDIDIVILSHADFDHIGGTVDEHGNLAFPKARYILPREEWAFWASKPERLRPSDAYDEEFRRIGHEVPARRLEQLRDKLELIEAGAEIVPGIRMLGAPGHTPGYTVIAVASDGAQFLSIGDLVYDPADIADPNWYSVFDFDPKQVVVTRRRILDHAAREGALLMAYHVPFPGLGHVVQNGSGWLWSSVGLPT